MNQQQLELFAALHYALRKRIAVYRVVYEPGRPQPVVTIFRGTYVLQPPAFTRSPHKEKK